MRYQHVWLALVLAIASPCAAQDATATTESPVVAWRTDTAQALEAARADGKTLLLHFAGTDWSEGCQRLIEAVFEQPGFAAIGDQPDLILLRVDFPRDPELQSDAVRDANIALQERYRVTRYPSVFLADPQGRAFAQFDTRAFLGPKSFVEQLASKREILARRDAAWGDVEAAGREQLEAGLDTVDPALWRHYRPELERILLADPEVSPSEGGRFRKALDGLEAEDAVPALMAEVQRLFSQGRLGDAIGSVDRFLVEHREVMSAGLRQTLLFSKSGLTARVGDFESAVAALDEAVAVDPDSTLAEQMQSLRARLAASLPPADGRK